MQKVKEPIEERSKPSHEVDEAFSTVPRQPGDEAACVGRVTSPPGGESHSQVHTEHYYRALHSRKQVDESTQTLIVIERNWEMPN